MPNRRSKIYKPSPSDLALATSTIWDRWNQDVVLDDGLSYRDVNGVEFDPGEYTQTELLQMLYDVVDAWTPGNYGSYGARQFLVNMVERGLLTVERPDGRGLPSKYTVGIDSATGKPYTREAFTQTAHERRRTAYEQAQREKATWATPAVPDAPQPRLEPSDYAEILADINRE